MIHSEGISVSSEIKQNWWGGWSCCDLFASWLGASCMWRLVFFLSHLMLWRNAAVHFALNYKSGTYAFFWFVTWCLSCKPLHGHVMVYNAIKVPTITFVICNHRIQLLSRETMGMLVLFVHIQLWQWGPAPRFVLLLPHWSKSKIWTFLKYFFSIHTIKPQNISTFINSKYTSYQCLNIKQLQFYLNSGNEIL